ncbi:MAG: hypothetical protein Q9167_003370 [Letrouitia subvulpina]
MVLLMIITEQMCQAFIPLIKKGGRIVNVSSEASSLKNYSREIQQRFRDPNISLQGIEKLLSDFQVICVEAAYRRCRGLKSWTNVQTQFKGHISQRAIKAYIYDIMLILGRRIGELEPESRTMETLRRNVSKRNMDMLRW